MELWNQNGLQQIKQAHRFGQNKYVGIRIPKSVLTNDLFVYHNINQDAIAAALFGQTGGGIQWWIGYL